MGKLEFSITLIEHESQIIIALHRFGEKPGDGEQLDTGSVGGRHIIDDVDELQDAYFEAILQKADYIRETDTEHCPSCDGRLEMGGEVGEQLVCPDCGARYHLNSISFLEEIERGDNDD